MAHKTNELNRAEKKYKNKREGFKLLVKELLSNAFHAIILNEAPNTKTINLDATVVKDKDDIYKKVEIAIKDTGCGFLDQDKKYFEDLDDPNPRKIAKKLPSKGEGRLALCYFTDNTTYETIFQKDDDLYIRRFEYPNEGQDLFHFDSAEKLTNTQIHTGTTVKSIITNHNKLSSAKTFFEKDWEIWLLETFFPYLIKNEFVLKVNGNQMKIENEYSESSFDLSIGIENYKFKTYFITQNDAKKKGIEVFYIGENMVLENREYKLDWTVPYTKILVGSSYFDKNIDPVGVVIELTEEEKELINSKIDKVCEKHFSEILESIKTKNQVTQKQVAEESPFLDGVLECHEEHKEYDKNRFYEEAYIKIGKQQRKILNASKLNDDDYNKAEELASRNLMQYILLREILIDQFEDAKSDKPEDFFHNKIMKMRSIESESNSNLIDLSSPNLWILDERFMSYQKAFSAISLKKIMHEIGDKSGSISIADDGIPDILVLLSEENEKDEASDIIIIELKDRTPGKRKIRDIDGEMRERISALYDHKQPPIRRVFTYGVIELNEKVKKELRSNGYRELHGQSDYYYQYAEVIMDDETPVRAVLNLLSWDALIKDARVRNKTFMDVLRRSFHHE